jgi:hypothetical protein
MADNTLNGLCHANSPGPKHALGSGSDDAQVINWPTAATILSALDDSNPIAQHIIYDTDIIKTLVDVVNEEINRYINNPLHDDDGNALPYPGGGLLQTINLDANGQTSLDKHIVNGQLWLDVVNRVKALQNAWRQPSTLSTSPVDKSDGADIINAAFIRSIIDNLNNTVINQSGCTQDCKCNVVCSCNGNCGCNYSDERLKANIQTLESGILDNVRAVKFQYLAADKVTALPQKHYGVIAQSLLNTELRDSEALTQDLDGYYMVNYQQLIGPLIAEVQNLKQQVTSLTKQVIDLEAKINRV